MIICVTLNLERQARQGMFEVGYRTTPRSATHIRAAPIVRHFDITTSVRASLSCQPCCRGSQSIQRKPRKNTAIESG